MRPVEIVLSSMFDYVATINVIVNPDGIALEGNEEIELRLVPLPPWNETAGVVIQSTIELSIIDSDSMLSMSHIARSKFVEPS